MLQIEQPSEVPETICKLAATTFVTTVEAPSLAIMSPTLHRGLSEAAQAILRQTSIIIDNTTIWLAKEGSCHFHNYIIWSLSEHTPH